MLRYLYTDDPARAVRRDVALEDAYDLAKLADKYDLPDLRSHCLQNAEKCITREIFFQSELVVVGKGTKSPAQCEEVACKLFWLLKVMNEEPMQGGAFEGLEETIINTLMRTCAWRYGDLASMIQRFEDLSGDILLRMLEWQLGRQMSVAVYRPEIMEGRPKLSEQQVVRSAKEQSEQPAGNFSQGHWEIVIAGGNQVSEEATGSQSA